MWLAATTELLAVGSPGFSVSTGNDVGRMASVMLRKPEAMRPLRKATAAGWKPAPRKEEGRMATAWPLYRLWGSPPVAK